jgi:hypothetical protein
MSASSKPQISRRRLYDAAAGDPLVWLQGPVPATSGEGKAHLCAQVRPVLKGQPTLAGGLHATGEDIEAWHKSRLLTNIGVVYGVVSNNTVVLDFDGPGGYPAFVATFPHLAETFIVATGGGGSLALKPWLELRFKQATYASNAAMTNVAGFLRRGRLHSPFR